MSDPRVEQEIIGLEHECMEAVARRDGAALDRILADEFVIAGWQPEGRLADKKFYVEDCLIPVEVHDASYSFDAWNIRVFGDTAVVNYTLDVHAVIAGHEWGGAFLITDVWLRRDGRWQLATRHTSPVLAAQGAATQ
jgi:hypothetical protein